MARTDPAYHVTASAPNGVSPFQHRWIYDENSRCIYAGEAVRGADEADESAWTLNSFEYDVSGNCIKRKVAFDSWTNYENATYS
jgi:hypothetical protein